MCKIFGISSPKEYVLNEYLREFYKGSVEHPHGWGLAIMEGSDTNLEKEPIQATKSHYLRARLLPSLSAKNAFAHIRYATVGNIDYHNCHPYTKRDVSGRRWTLVHNGTIFDYPKLNAYFKTQDGDTDSERILLHIIDVINQHPEVANNAQARFRLIDEVVSDLSEGNKLNLLIFDSEYTYVHTNYPGTLYYVQDGETTLFCTSPLGHKTWDPVPPTRLHVFHDGKHIYEGQDHGKVYVESEENIKYLYRNFSNL